MPVETPDESFVRGDVDRLVGILVSDEDAGLVVDPSQQHELGEGTPDSFLGLFLINVSLPAPGRKRSELGEGHGLSGSAASHCGAAGSA